ncbi:dihydrodipicolinate synthase family protein [Burkholderia sp. Bp9012]|uniref:dihydrodipicolinate synthase family protein n=1 Tax=Burkholderia sp. Bp9012 TaxID=2184562 RepID=UPI000F5A1A1B|nr:dihydrodipicolinate synthase family protein [Burkholderia sp. Bp9012]RQR79133.1 dihydrodipicolinate synthase family protein [Burkholderia sp. Bp9012]
MIHRIEGIVVPLVTPLATDFRVCERSVARLIDSVRNHATALLPALSSGEGGRLCRSQWNTMVHYTVRHAGGLPVCPGAIVESDDELLARSRFAADAGAAGLTVVVPPLGGADTEAVIARFQRLSVASPLPLFLYHHGSEGDIELVVQALCRLCQLPRVLGIKESSRRPEIVLALNQCALPCGVLQGWEDLLWQAPGADGHAVALANLEIAACARMRSTPSEPLQRDIDRWCEDYQLFDDDWYAAIKRELHQRGLLSTALTTETAFASPGVA